MTAGVAHVDFGGTSLAGAAFVCIDGWPFGISSFTPDVAPCAVGKETHGSYRNPLGRRTGEGAVLTTATRSKGPRGPWQPWECDRKRGHAKDVWAGSGRGRRGRRTQPSTSSSLHENKKLRVKSTSSVCTALGLESTCNRNTRLVMFHQMVIIPWPI